jgi:23S rRNA (cytosine1962-C5)-methyltransferase
VAALAIRARIVPELTTAYRILHGEGDGLPGVVCDRYGDHAVLKLDGDGILALRGSIVEILAEQLAGLGVRGLLERGARRHGGSVEVVWGDPPPPESRVLERGMTLVASLWAGQKTGLFLDHRESRARVRGLARDLSVLNLYGYTGGFSVAAALGGAAEVTTVDVAKPALDLASRTFEANGLAAARHCIEAADVPEYLARATAAGERFDLIVADPPNFAPNARSVERATESYHKLHAACCALLPPGGLYLAASCSSHIRAGAFLDTLREGSRRAGRILTVLEQHGAPADHPRRLAFPEGDYLKVVLAHVE